MKTFKTLSAALILGLSLTSHAQDSKPDFPDWRNQINKQEWAQMIDLLQNEKWQDADKMVTECLNRISPLKNLNSDASILRYMLITSVAGELSNGIIDNTEALKRLKGLEGQEIITPTLTFKSKGILNVLMISDNGKSWMKDTTNTEANTMMLSEIFEVATPDMLNNTTRFNNKQFRLKAVIKNIKADRNNKKYLTIDYTDTDIWDITY